MDISNDAFIRTTDPAHKEAVQYLWKSLVANGQIYLADYEGWYSVRDECFYTDSELVDGKAPTGADVEWIAKEKSYFFKLSEFEEKLLEFYEQNPDFIAPVGRRNEVVSFVKGGLRDLSISRTSFKWGIPVPDDNEHVMYVWVDALMNYISALGYPESDNFNKFWPASLHVVGKDILRFHAVYWPAMLMAAGIPIPKRLFAHGWWTNDGEKISKSLGNVIDPIQLVEQVRRADTIEKYSLRFIASLTLSSCQYGVDQTRFFLMAEIGFGNDGDFSDDAFIRRVNSNLANELGNLCQRTLSMVFKNCEKAVPSKVGLFTEQDVALLSSARGLRERAAGHISSQAIHKYVETMIEMVWEANKYIDDMAPWSLKKTDFARMETVLYILLEVLRHIAILYQPLIPGSSNKMLNQLTVPENERTFAFLTEDYMIKLGSPISQPEGVFPRLEVKETVTA